MTKRTLLLVSLAALLAVGRASAAGGTWTPRAPLPTARHAAAVGTINGRIYAAGGYATWFSNVLDIYDPGTNTWSPGAPAPLLFDSQGAVIDGTLYVTGGNMGGYATNHHFAYNAATNQWSFRAPMPSARCHAGVAAYGGKLYVVGGTNTQGSAWYGMLEVYDPATNSWTSRAPMPTPRQQLCLVELGGLLYAVGGRSAAQPVCTNVMEVYNPATNTWSSAPPMPTARYFPGTVSHQGLLYAAGGYSPTGFTSVVEIYDPSSGTWGTGPALPKAALGVRLAALNGAIYAMGGDNGSELADVYMLTTISPPTLSVPGAIAQECDGGGSGATVHFVVEAGGDLPAASLLEVRDTTGNRLLLSAPAAEGPAGVEATFPLGASVVVARILDGATVLASASFTVQIEDTVPPALSGDGAKTIECAGSPTPITPALLGIAASDACDPSPAITLAPSMLELGTTQVTATARDATGNTTSSAFPVTVVDTIAPYFLVRPQDIEAECTGSEGALVRFDVLAADLCGDVQVVSLDGDRAVDPAGSSYAVGEHTVTCTATDSSGNSASTSFRITVIDTDAPVLICPADITTSTDPKQCFASVFFDVDVTDECDPDATVECTVDGQPVESGDPFPVGLTEVVCTAKDHAGNTVTGSFRVLVQDKEPPSISAPAAVTLVTDCAGRPLTMTPGGLGVSALDNCDVTPALAVSPSTLGPGTTTVTCTATDDDGNASSATVSVTVLRGSFEWQFLRPLDGNVDNLIRPGQTVPLKLKVACDNVFEPGATATIESVVCIDSEGTPIANEAAEDSGLANDGGPILRLEDGYYVHNLSTKGWSSVSGLRFRVTVKVTKAGHADTLCEVVLKNR